MIIQREGIQHRDVVSKLVVMDSLEGFAAAWEGFLKDVFDRYGGTAQMPFYSLKYSRKDRVGIEMYAPVVDYRPEAGSGFRHQSYFELWPLLGVRLMGGAEDMAVESLERIRTYLIDNGIIQTSPVFYFPQAAGEAGYTDCLVVYRPRSNSD
jgi:hypothetical protein